MKCVKCNSRSLKNGSSANGRQRFKCISCGRSFQRDYSYEASKPQTSKKITTLVKEGCGIRSISRILRISTTTVQRRIITISKQIKKPLVASRSSFEMDELCTFVGRKRNSIWVAYAIDRKTGIIADFRARNRTKKTLRGIIETLELAKAKKVYTDKLRNYPFIIPQEIHSVYNRCTNHIERHNLTLRHQLRRLQRKTLCYSKSIVMLSACLKIAFWG